MRTIINNYVLVEFIIQNGSGLQLFSSFKDWVENCTFIIRDKEEYITQSITVSWIAQVHSRAVINCKLQQIESNFGNFILQYPWPTIVQNPVPNDVAK